MVECPKNLLEGEDSNMINWAISAFFWITSTSRIIFDKNVQKGIKSLDFNYLIGQASFTTILGFYSIYLLCLLFTTGFRKFMIFQSIHTVLRKNIENKFKIKYHGEAWHSRNRHKFRRKLH